ncbi:FO synthase subunit 1 [Calothrix sp. NIES-4101]|nr:FO synthase subunit 1 [Calothrix sp. NIES-4101]
MYITYSPAYTIVPTYECFNRCTYCNFRAEPGKSPWISLSEAEKRLQNLQNQHQNNQHQVCEILILSGEVHPHSSRRQEWFQLIYNLCELALKMGFLPHTNAGILSFEEMRTLKQVNVSMGLMLEQITPKLSENVHKYAPSKLPATRLQQLQWAGELQVPFTTGILLGIGETESDREDSLEAISRIHKRYHHIQEVILQPYSPGSQESYHSSVFNPLELPKVIAKAREILPKEIVIQIPPNLVTNQEWLIACLEAGATDLGGISPKDEVNPDYSHPQAEILKKDLATQGWTLVPRLPIYPQFDKYLSKEIQIQVQQWRHNIHQL